MPENHPSTSPESRPPYQPPAVENLGKWQAITLQYSVPFNGSGPFGDLPDLSDTDIEAFNGLNDFGPDL